MTPIFKDISNFSNTSDYLPIIDAVLFVETIILHFALAGYNRSNFLQYWYKKFKLSAVLADVCIVTIIIIATRFLYHYFFTKFSIWLFVLLAVTIQIVHDILFYNFFVLVPRGINSMLDTFKNYASEVRYFAIIGDSVVVILSCLLASYLANFSLNINIINLITTLYFIPYALHA